MALEYWTYDGEGRLVWAPSGRRLTESEIKSVKELQDIEKNRHKIYMN